MVDAEFHNRARRDVDGVALLEFRDAFLVHVGAVLDRVASGAEGRHDAVFAVAVCGDDAAGAVRFVDDRLEFAVRKLLAERIVGDAEHAAGCEDLDACGATPDQQPHGTATFVFAVG